MVPAPPWIASPISFVSIFGLFSGRPSAVGVGRGIDSLAGADAAAVKSIKAEKQLAAQALAILIAQM